MENQTKYFNLIADGLGFLNRPRLVKTRKNEYYAITIQAARGEVKEKHDKSRFDLRVVGGEAKELIEKLLNEFPSLTGNDYKQAPKVAVGFRAGDIVAVHFDTKDKETGELVTMSTIDGRLIKFKFIKVNGKEWYKEQNIVNENTSIPA